MHGSSQWSKNLWPQHRILLKAEWMRVRRGELVYRIAKAVAAFAMLAGVVLLVYAVLASAVMP